MKHRKRRIIVLISVVAAVLSIGCGKQQPEEPVPVDPVHTAEELQEPVEEEQEILTSVEAENLEKESYTKTIHDFPDHLIDNLDDQENTNFVAYAKGVKRVTTDGEHNIIENVDPIQYEYVISNPDEQITSLEKGDVIFMDPSAEYDSGISVKVENMELQENQIVITGGEMTLDELIEYADIDMLLSPDEIYTYESENNAPEGEMDSSEGNWLQDIYEMISLESEITTPAFSGGGSFVLKKGGFSAKGALNVQTSKIHVVFRYSPLVDIWHFSVDGDFSASVRGGFEGKVGISNMELINIPPIFFSIAGPVGLMLDFSPALDATASIGANVGASISCHTYSSAYVWKGIPFVDACYTQLLDKDMDYSIAEINGLLSLNILNADVDLGVPMVAEFSVKELGGAELKGTLKKPKWTGNGEESIHDCEACIDGQVQGYLRTNISIDINKLRKKADDMGNLSWTPFNTPITMPSPYDKFYVSFRDQQEPEFGFGKCPHHRWRADVSVLREGTKEPVPEEIVKIQWPDGEEKLEVSDEKGKLTVYLPKGDNLLSAEEEDTHLKGKVHAVIEEEPIEVELLLGGGNLHVIFAEQEQDPIIDDHDTNSWYELQSTLIDMYPEAKWYYGFSPEELCSNGNVEQGDIVLDITYDAPHTDNGRWNDDYLEDGDQSNIWGEGGGWIFTGIYRICKNQDSGLIMPHMTFGLSVSYDPARKAYLTNPQISSEQYIIRAFQDMSAFYNDEYLLISYGPREEGGETWNEEEIYIDTDYMYDTEVIFSIPRERKHLPSLVSEYLPKFVGPMIDQWDLDQMMVIWH